MIILCRQERLYFHNGGADMGWMTLRSLFVVLIAALAFSASHAATTGGNCHQPVQPLTCHCLPTSERFPCPDTAQHELLLHCSDRAARACLLNILPVGIVAQTTTLPDRNGSDLDIAPPPGIDNIRPARFESTHLLRTHDRARDGSRIYLITQRFRN